MTYPKNLSPCPP